MSDKVNELLIARGAVYGKFNLNAETSNSLKIILRARMSTRPEFTAIHKEAIDMICHKLARIVSGNPNYIDNWQDIAGYAELVVRDLERGNSTESTKPLGV